MPQKKLLKTGRFAYQDFSPIKSVEAQEKNFIYCFDVWCHFDNKVPKTKHKEYGFHYCHNWKSPYPDRVLWSMDSARCCSFGSGWDAFVMLCVSSTERRLSQQAGRVAGESWETAWLLICVVAPSTQVESPCKDPLLRKCSVQFWKTILSASDEYL